MTDDDLSHMTDAVALGRKIYDNLKRAIQYIVSIHIPIILIVTVPLIAGWSFTDIFTSGACHIPGTDHGAYLFDHL